MEWLAALCPCFGPRSRRSNEPDERTRLLQNEADPDSIPQSLPPDAFVAGKPTEQELRHQEMLRMIVDKASDRIISVAAPSPLSHVRDTASTPETSAWRALVRDDITPPNQPGAHRRADGSVHSLRTIPRNSTPRMQPTIEDESQFGTVASYKTAYEAHDDDEAGSGSLTPTRSRPPPSLAALWDIDSLPEPVPVTPEDDQFMRSAIARLQNAIVGKA